MRLLLLFVGFAPVVSAQPTPPPIVWVQPTGASSLAFTPDGSTLITTAAFTDNRYIQRWDVETGALVYTLTGHPQLSGPWYGPNALAFSPDGTSFAIAHGDRFCTNDGCIPEQRGVLTWGIDGTPEPAITDLPAIPNTLAYSPDGALLAVVFGFPGADIQIYDATSLALVRTLPDTWEIGEYSRLRFTADGSSLEVVVRRTVSGTVDQHLLRFDATTGALQREIVLPSAPLLKLSADRQIAVTERSQGRRVDVWRVGDAGPPESLFTVDLTINPAYCCVWSTAAAFTPNGAYLALYVTQSSAPDASRIRFYDLSDGTLVHDYQDGTWGPARALAFSEARDHSYVFSSAQSQGNQIPGQLLLAETSLNLVNLPSSADPPVRGEGISLTPRANPARGDVRLRLSLRAPETLQIEAFDALGRRVHASEAGARSAGVSEIHLDTRSWSPGLYLIRVTTTAGEVATATISLLR